MKIQVLVVRPGEAGVTEEHPNTLDAQQKLVGGYIEAVSIGDGITMICNEEGKLHGLAPNFAFPRDIVVGTVFFCRTDAEGECASLTSTDVAVVNALVETCRNRLRTHLGREVASVRRLDDA